MRFAATALFLHPCATADACAVGLPGAQTAIGAVQFDEERDPQYRHASMKQIGKSLTVTDFGGGQF